MSRVEEAKKKIQRHEAYRRCETSWEDSLVLVDFSTVTEEATNKENWGMDFSSVTEGAANEVEWATWFSSVTEGVDLRFRGGGSWPDVVFLDIRGVTEIR
jgi:hypothetical protein